MIDKQVLKDAGIEYETIIKRFNNSDSMFEIIMRAFVKDTVIDRAIAAYEAKNIKDLADCAHEAKGMCGNVGFTEAYNAASDLMQLLRSGTFTDETLSQSFNRFRDSYIATREAIKAALA